MVIVFSITMLWSVDSADTIPLHEQIAANVRRAIASGELTAGDRLPAATELGGVLGVNSNTVLRAYRRLRDEGVLEFRRGRGVQVAQDAALGTTLTEAAGRLLDLGRVYGYGPEALSALLHRLERR